MPNKESLAFKESVQSLAIVFDFLLGQVERSLVELTHPDCLSANVDHVGRLLERERLPLGNQSRFKGISAKEVFTVLGPTRDVLSNGV